MKEYLIDTNILIHIHAGDLPERQNPSILLIDGCFIFSRRYPRRCLGNLVLGCTVFQVEPTHIFQVWAGKTYLLVQWNQITL